jgi:hypothetical protein
VRGRRAPRTLGCPRSVEHKPLEGGWEKCAETGVQEGRSRVSAKRARGDDTKRCYRATVGHRQPSSSLTTGADVEDVGGEGTPLTVLRNEEYTDRVEQLSETGRQPRIGDHTRETHVGWTTFRGGGVRLIYCE